MGVHVSPSSVFDQCCWNGSWPRSSKSRLAAGRLRDRCGNVVHVVAVMETRGSWVWSLLAVSLCHFRCADADSSNASGESMPTASDMVHGRSPDAGAGGSNLPHDAETQGTPTATAAAPAEPTATGDPEATSQANEGPREAPTTVDAAASVDSSARQLDAGPADGDAAEGDAASDDVAGHVADDLPGEERDASAMDAGVPHDSGAEVDADREQDTEPATALGGPSTIAPGGVAVLQLEALALATLQSVTLQDAELLVTDRENVRFVLAQPDEASYPVELTSLDLTSLSLEREDLTAMPEVLVPLLRVAVRVPESIMAGAAEFRLETSDGNRYSWPVEIITPDAAFVPPTPDGIMWPAISNHDGVFPIGTEGPYFPLVDPIFEQSYPVPYSSVGVTYQISLLAHDGASCIEAAPVTGVISGEERVDGIGVNPIEGWYDIAAGNVVELTIDRTSIGGEPEHYTGGWATGELDAVAEPTGRGQMAPPQPGYSFIVLHATRTGLPLVINYKNTDLSFEQACPSTDP